jgi:hypothetical protein
VAEQQENLVWERAMESAPRLDGRADDQKFRPPLRRNAGHFLPEAPRARADDLTAHPDAVGAGHRGCGLEPLSNAHELPVEVCVERQLALQDGRCDEDDSGAAIGGEPAGEVDRVLGLRVVEQRDDDRAVRDRTRPAREATSATMERSDVGKSHRSSW